MKKNEQQLILVDDKDDFLGKYAPKSKCHTGKGLRHRAFTLLIRNSKNEVLLQQRKHLLWDKCWDLTNSHPLHKKGGTNESYDESVSRCLKWEWGIDFPIKKLFAFNYFARIKVLPKAGSYFAQFGNFCENEYCAFMIGEYNGEVYPNPEVAYGYKWMPLSELLEDIKIHSEIYTPWLLKALGELQKRKLKLEFSSDLI